MKEDLDFLAIKEKEGVDFKWPVPVCFSEILYHLQVKPSFELSGKLAAETNRVRGERLFINM
jgi:hypothetical protein